MVVVEVSIVNGYNLEHYGYFEAESLDEVERTFHDAPPIKWFIEELEVQELPNNIILANEV
jgi:hypothetical protein